MDGQTLARIGKAALAVAGAVGIQIDPEHVEAIASGVAAVYAAITAIEAWLKKGNGTAGRTKS